MSESTRYAPLVVGVLALVLGAPVTAQPSDPAPKLKSKGCLASITYVVRDGVRHQCGYSYNQKFETCVLVCNPAATAKALIKQRPRHVSRSASC